jgi:hypothetical protein
MLAATATGGDTGWSANTAPVVASTANTDSKTHCKRADIISSVAQIDGGPADCPSGH